MKLHFWIIIIINSYPAKLNNLNSQLSAMHNFKWLKITDIRLIWHQKCAYWCYIDIVYMFTSTHFIPNNSDLIG